MGDAADALGCKDYLLSLPPVLTEAFESTSPIEGAQAFSAIYLVGTGALGVSLDTVATLFRSVLALPILRVSSHQVVRFAPSSLVIAASFAGDTPETTEQVARAFDSGATVILAAASGPLRDVVLRRGGEVIDLDGGAPGPRWAVVECIVALVTKLSSLANQPDADAITSALARSISRFTTRIEASEAWREAATLAHRIDRTMVLALGSGDFGAVAAHRLASQIEENAKTFAVALSYPEIGYSTVAGFGQCGDVTRQVFTAVELCEHSESAADARRRAVVADVLDEQVATRLTLIGDGETPLEQFFDLVARIDQLSLALAHHVGIDPGPVPAIVEVKKAAANLA